MQRSVIILSFFAASATVIPTIARGQEQPDHNVVIEVQPPPPPPEKQPPPQIPSVVQHPPIVTTPPHLNLEASIGFGTPVGWAGIGASVRPSPFFAISGGIGFGTYGRQIAMMLHGYPIAFSNNAHLGFGAGVSTGTYVDTSLHNADSRWDLYIERAWLLNAQVSINVWDRSGFGVEPFIGYGAVLNSADGACAHWNRQQSCEGTPGVVYLGLTFRGGFWL